MDGSTMYYSIGVVPKMCCSTQAAKLHALPGIYSIIAIVCKRHEMGRIALCCSLLHMFRFSDFLFRFYGVPVFFILPRGALRFFKILIYDNLK